MIKASSLFYAIVISIIIAIVSSSFILFAYVSRIEFDNLQIKQQLNSNANSGLNLLMAQQSLIELDQPKILDLYDFGEDSVFLQRKLWGAFEVLISRAFSHHTQTERIALAGCPPDATDAYCLYLADEGKPLALCGQTKITGTAFLPKSGVERAYIEGQNFMGSKLINGTILKSKSELPTFNPELLKKINELLTNKKISETDSLIQLQRAFSGDSIHNSFKNNTLVLSHRGSIRLEDAVYSGNLVIISDTIITVMPSAVLKDVILAAPKILFAEDFKGQLQAFASDSIIVRKNVTLRYPSVLGVANNNGSSACAITLEENDTVMGTIFSYQRIIDAYKRAGVRINKKSVVIGQVYSNGYAELKGSIFGSLMCSKFLLQTPSSVYENHLLNAEINGPALPAYYTGITLIKESSYKKIIKWVD